MKGIGYFNHAPSGCFWYRIKHPMDALNAHGVRTEMITLNQDVVLDELQALQVYGIYPFSFDKALKYVKSEDKRIVYDIDDALDLIDPTNPFYYSVRRDAGSEREIFALADHITVATPFLAEYARTKTNVPITVVPNCYDPNEWTFPRPKREGIRIGFAGSCTHIEDLLLVLPAIKNLQKKYGIKFLVMGFATTDYRTWLTHFKYASPPEGLESIAKFEALVEGMNIEWIPYVDFDHYPSTLINMSLDIGLCPLVDTPFNRARSASKAMEYTLSGALALASDLEPYRNEMTSILVKDDEWENSIEKAILGFKLDLGAINTIRNTQLDWLKENRDINTKIDLLKSAYVV